MLNSLFIKKEKRNFKWAILLSILIHSLFLIKIVHKQNPFVSSKVQKNKRKVKLTFESKSKKLQIITTKNINKKRPKDSRFLSKNNQKVDREIVAKNIGKYKEAGLGVFNGERHQVKNQKLAKVKRLKKVQKKKIVKSYRKILKNKKISLADLSFHKNIPKVKASKASPAEGVKAGPRGHSGLASNNDFLEDIPLGDATKLNTVEFKYYGFYFRIKQKLEQHWGSNLKAKAKQLFKRGRNIASNINHITSLKIILDNRGNIIDILVKSTSGVTELDDAAVDSFNKAGPFPNPPKGMLSNGRANIEWGFVVKS